MSYKSRKVLYKQISEERGNPIIAYVTSIRPGLSASMAADAISPIIKQIEAVPKEADEIDFIIISNGGDPITSMRIMSLLRERFKTVNVLLPYSAFSAATIFALGANKIIMHPYSNLGPVDPQLTVSHPDPNGRQSTLKFSSEDVSNYITFIKEDVGITDQQHLVTAVQPLLKDLGAFAIGYAKRGQQLSLRLSEKMLNWHMTNHEQAKAIAQSLNSSFYHHGYPVSRTEAKEIGLPIEDPNKTVEQLLWLIWEDFKAEMKCDNAFNPQNEILNDREALSKISVIPVLNLPADLPNEMKNAVLNNYIQNFNLQERQALHQTNLIASIESENLAQSVYNIIDILYWRDINQALQYSADISDTGWTDYMEE